MSETKEIDRLVKFAEMMLGQLKSARASSEAAAAVSKALTGAELMMHEQSRIGFERCIKIGEEALAPFRHELTVIG